MARGRDGMTYREAIAFGEETLREADIADSKIDSWLLLAMAAKIDHTYYYIHIDEEMASETLHEFEVLIKKRAERVPLQYITGEQEFMGLPFTVNSNVLVPRQDTETLVEEALKVTRPGMRVIDMCTGSGCVLISILKNVHGVTGAGYDISKQAIIVAKENAKKNEVSAVFERSNLFEDVPAEKVDVIVSNPPYIPSGEIPTLMPEVSEFEPRQALDGGEDGLDCYRRITSQCGEYLKPGGHIFLEIGCDQGNAVSAMLREAGYEEISVVKDLSGNDRVVKGLKKEGTM
jgi:release factor glutamine methyltransferase